MACDSISCIAGLLAVSGMCDDILWIAITHECHEINVHKYILCQSEYLLLANQASTIDSASHSLHNISPV